jgi:hypothetical protein
MRCVAAGGVLQTHSPQHSLCRRSSFGSLSLSLIAQGGVAAAAAAKNDSKMLTTGPNFLGGRLRYDDYD